MRDPYQSYCKSVIIVRSSTIYQNGGKISKHGLPRDENVYHIKIIVPDINKLQ